MRKVFDDSDELTFFCDYLSAKLNIIFNKRAEKLAIEPIIEITAEDIKSVIEIYEK